jgi:DMSO reductase family type II enzyme heme b subunit
MKGHFKTMLIFTVPLLGLSAIYFLIVYSMSQARSDVLIDQEPIVIRYTNLEIPLDPEAEYWKRIEPVKVHLVPQVARVPYGTEERDIWVKGAFNDREIGFHIEFEDDTENWGAPENPDACAILFVPEDSPATAQMMGYGSTANVWQWLADRDAERYVRGNENIQAVRELIASGPGTQTPLKDQNVEGKGVYRDGKWSVVFKRRLESRQEGELPFSSGTDKMIAFARWDGAKMESFSRKSIAILRTLTLERD